MDQVSSEARWEQEAENWVRWARAPDRDAYWHYSPSFFEDIVPPPGTQTIDIGCGEGRSTRDLQARGHRVIGIDSSPTLLRYAREADPAGRYELADAARLPLADASCDVVIAYNSLMDVSDLAGSVREAARVMRSGGHFCISVTHPVNDAGAFSSADADAPFVIDGSYLKSRRFFDRVERDGLTMTFFGWTHSLEDYFRALEGAGLHVDRLREPPPSPETVRRKSSYARWRRIPLFLQLRAIKP